MKLSREEVLHIAALAKLGVTESDVERFREQLSNILENFEAIQKLDTTGVPPTAQSLVLQNVIMPDEVKPSLSSREVLANAPQPEGDFFKIKIVLED
ncbi:MAG TPA: Asp-tRNA(Asn)/Glu-tRNA(Gln) amidotransferase subunit GatC [Dehalococcoidales bacterium]|nr:Asp-tRNA(Asn)/Glu-tRNA(Gln) amidotransferase subunit GatC [Dehalococcoidales bacterium]